MSSLGDRTIGLARHCARGVPRPLLSSLLCPIQECLGKVNYAHFTNKNVPRTGLRWVVASRATRARGAGELDPGRVGGTSSVSVALGLFSYKHLFLRVIF